MKQASRQVQMMGTTIDLLFEAEEGLLEALLDEAIERLKLYNHRFSANDADSELSAINQAAGLNAVSVQGELYELIKKGKEESLAEPSNLDIALGPVVQSWRIGFDDARKPSEQEIEQALKLTDPEQIQLNDAEQSVFLARSGMKIDLGALAKGYIADLLMAWLKTRPVQSALINLGGNVLVYGDNSKQPDGLWWIGLQAPGSKRGQHMGLIPIQNASLVTSGIYERQFELDGQCYHHIFDRKTGQPIETEMASLTIQASSSLACEIWSSRLFGLDLWTAMSTINAVPDIEGIIVLKNQKILLSDGMKNKFQALPE
ncbi:FAD:protein FMN transferase [Lactococcus termiticola]|uniref:FAD:protein FMN transferase n=1 Tax=Lactococcus termiticola TaxID=2169526 RepID=A0A2R5HJZ1_9LACT|nr:FAD:protein FMN transferase [Lactococcus termiticola]GBG96731.1 thiamine biosynthesis lipoprotein [Lactococcus termiticola]